MVYGCEYMLSNISCVTKDPDLSDCQTLKLMNILRHIGASVVASSSMVASHYTSRLTTMMILARKALMALPLHRCRD